jgi:hypothetical protein
MKRKRKCGGRCKMGVWLYVDVALKMIIDKKPFIDGAFFTWERYMVRRKEKYKI